MTTNKLDIILNEITELEKSNDPAIPKWAKALIVCFKGLIEELRSVHQLTKRIQELENIKINQGKINCELENENYELKNELSKLKSAYGNEELRSRNYSILLQIILVITMILTVLSFFQVFSSVVSTPEK